MSAEAGRPAALPTTSLPRRGGAGLPAGTRRAASLRLAIAGVAVAALIVYAVLWFQVSPARERGTDFSASYVAALLVRAGQGGQIYDQALEAARHAAILLPGYRVNLPFITPPTTALLAIPLSFLDPGMAFRLFSLVQLLLLAVAAGVAARAGPWPQGSRGAQLVAAGAGLAGTATLPLLLLGQWDGVCALGLALAYAAWRRDRSFTAGLWLALGFGIAKPHLAIGLLAFAIGRRDRRALLGIVAGSAGLIAASMAAVGPGATLGFIGASSFALGNTPAASTLGLLGLAASWLGAGSAATGIAIVGGVLGVAACGFLGWRSHGRPDRLEATLAGAAALSLVVAPHLLAHDLVVLAPAFVWVAARAARHDVPHPWPGRTGTVVLAGWLLLVLLIALDTGAGAPAPPGRLVPWGLTAAAAALAVWERRRRAPATGER
ncbi:MAG: glycosyltransferase family 87 protein [Candidatus Dormibacteria bacterium]